MKYCSFENKFEFYFIFSKKNGSIQHKTKILFKRPKTPLKSIFFDKNIRYLFLISWQFRASEELLAISKK
ncbi:hypothetical protein BJP43_10235 (plasmid) [Candidatus Williamhamiltonella defendens]|uniref:Uncharacterized protein n=1 Tax=Candidatus Williamhamiltonella defendens TaxID=138072 RepID=A0A2D3TG26_9ENTR|nr:hypothetical protein BJP43_10170 [Candidatus Hamiltonella defensa]ATW34767.1 hypothetical protein BJP43_10235 [Candidatus Hamiltonella defensa]AYB49955.1 hypothetical protein CJJ19_11070 [Candidatus Hamiltonella defensa]AYB49969.1 hypothetical protein CJJ19_11140 [Candidatus Hamiltonella defensa]